MELYVAEALIGDEDNVHDIFPGVKPENIKPSNYTHIFQCVYDEVTNLFHWGITTLEESLSLHITSIALNNAVQIQHNEQGIVPICRAYYKMKEIIEHYFPLWGWELPEGAVAVDVGASPGGWTQYLAVEKKCKCVVAIDPGELHESLLTPSSNVVNVRAIAQAPEVAEALLKVGGFQLCVCDVNFEADDATAMLVEHVLQYANVLNETSSVADVSLDAGTRRVCFTESAEGLPLGREKETYKSKLIEEDLCHSCTHWDRGTGYLVLTLKLPKNPKEKHMLRAVATAMKLLAPAKNDFAAKYGVCGWDFKVVHLNANSKNERTLVCKFHNIPKISSSA
jgi:23S rRNA U2552 (ribose-2'-O)-methylase RlmE/FtsJ